MSLSILTTVGTAWALALTVSGLWLMLGGPGSDLLPIPSTPRLLAGCLAVAAGHYVFVVVVANRLFPRVSGVPAAWFFVEIPAVAALAVLACALFVRYAGAVL